MAISWKNRRRQHGFQGRPLLCPALHRALFQWFISVRKCLRGRLWARNVKSAAEHLKKMIVKYKSNLGEPIPAMPIINSTWLFSFRRRNGISFRFPNRRYKVSRKKVKDGLRVEWLNAWGLRYAFGLLYGDVRKAKGLSLEPITHQVDQKPLHFNEGESKNTTTLEFTAAPSCPLKTNTSDSRSRLSVNTMVTYPTPKTEPDERYIPPTEVLPSHVN